MSERLLVTGGTGTVGQHVVRALADRGADVRPAVRDPDSVPAAIPMADDAVAFDFAKPETWGDALRDVDGLFLLRPPTVDRSSVAAFAAAADRVGVDRIAYLSALGAERNPLIPHHWIERTVASTDCAHTHLRASFFAQNLLEVHRQDVLERDEIFVPAGRGETSFVDARDVGEAAAVVLTEDGHANRAYDLTGPAAIDYAAVARIFSDVLGRSITYPDPSLLAFAARRWRRGDSPGFVALMCGIYTTARLGLADRVTDDARRLLGRDPRSMATFVADHADAFRPDAGASTARATTP